MRALAILSLVGLMGLSGCSTPSRMTHLRDQVREFGQQLRWNMLAGAAAFVVPSERQAWLDGRLRTLPGIRMTNVAIIRILSDGPQATKAQVFVGYTWYRMSDMKVMSSQWLQNWNHSEDGWLLIDESRVTHKGLVQDVNWP